MVILLLLLFVLLFSCTVYLYFFPGSLFNLYCYINTLFYIIILTLSHTSRSRKMRVLIFLSLFIFLYGLAAKSRVVESRHRPHHQIDLARRSREERRKGNAPPDGFDDGPEMKNMSNPPRSKYNESSEVGSKDPDVRSSTKTKDKVIAERRRPAPFLRAGM